MEQRICNKCKKEIKRGVRTDGGFVYPSSYTLELRKFTGEGRLFGTKRYDLCNKCRKKFEEFISSKKYDNDICNVCYKDFKKEFFDSEECSDSNNEQTTVEKYKENGGYAVANCIRATAETYGKNVMPIENTVQVGDMLDNIKSVMIAGNVHLHTTKKFNKLQKYMWKKLFGVEIKEKEIEK